MRMLQVCRGRIAVACAFAGLLGNAGCGPSAEPPSVDTAPSDSASLQAEERSRLSQVANGIFGTLPAEAASQDNPVTEAKVELGRILWYDERLSKNHDVACNSCHLLPSPRSRAAPRRRAPARRPVPSRVRPGLQQHPSLDQAVDVDRDGLAAGAAKLSPRSRRNLPSRFCPRAATASAD